jgi:tRNA-uridine 2-sulfurtransferase
MAGDVLGRHNGIINYTVGQRRGLGIAAGEPMYVIGLDASLSRVVVGPRAALRTTRMQLREVNWIGPGSDTPPDERTQVYVKVRSTRAPQPAWLVYDDGRFDVELVDGEDGVAPGQACVFYDAPDGQARVLGGGFISRAAQHVAAGRPAELATALDRP